MVGKAIEENRIDLYLQPIVTLPQRKVRHYEALSRLRTEDGEIVPAADFIDAAESAGLMPRLDNLALFRCVQVTRRLHMKNRDVGLFCNISAVTLTDAAQFRQLLDFMDANRALAPALTLEFTQNAYRTFGPIELEGLAALAERGFRFSMDHVVDLRMEPKDLAEHAFRFVKVPASLLLNKIDQCAQRHPPAGSCRPAGALRHRSDRRAHRKREHGARPARLRRALRPGLPVLAAAPGARRGAAGRRGRGPAKSGDPMLAAAGLSGR